MYKRQALTLREFEGLSYEDIASVMHCPVGTVRCLLYTSSTETHRAATRTRLQGIFSRRRGIQLSELETFQKLAALVQQQGFEQESGFLVEMQLEAVAGLIPGLQPVSYTHLDVYKSQGCG